MLPVAATAFAGLVVALFVLGPKLRSYGDSLELRNLIRILGSDDAGERMDALIALGIKGPQAAPAISAITAALRDSFELNRQLAARALANIGPPAEAALPHLIETLQNDTSSVRSTAALALGEIGPGARAAVPCLQDALEDSSGLVRLQAALALWKITGETEEAAPVLVANLKDEDDDVRRLSTRALGQMGLATLGTVPSGQIDPNTGAKQIDRAAKAEEPKLQSGAGPSDGDE